ncbi:MAG: hypothetical protein C4K47_05095 [Candidatus Thorarchaeota archaeon]|nr:MAG: hypothetical protein C4K47_05095 [Candidatus Thorarchaeota archaeon]
MHGQIATVDNQDPVFTSFLHPRAFLIPNAAILAQTDGLICHSGGLVQSCPSTEHTATIDEGQRTSVWLYFSRAHAGRLVLRMNPRMR